MKELKTYDPIAWLYDGSKCDGQMEETEHGDWVDAQAADDQIKALQADLATLQARLIERTAQSAATAYRDAERIRVLEEARDSPKKPCRWEYDDRHCKWDTECGKAHVFLDPGPSEHGMKFCPYCGAKPVEWPTPEEATNTQPLPEIQTHHAPHADPPWIALNMADARKLLEGYPLTEAEKTSLPALMAGYCRLIDEADLLGYGQTEAEAIAAIPGKEGNPK